jgi:hypothetical protein
MVAAATTLPGRVSASPCFEAKGLAATVLGKYSCGMAYPHTCHTCKENYDGEGADLATCALDTEICYQGVCGKIEVSAVWKASAALYSQGLKVVFTSGLQGDIFFYYNYLLGLGETCEVLVNNLRCASCVVTQCDPNVPTSRGAYVDCNNLGQGTFDFCDNVNSGNPGNMIKYLRLPEKCGSGGEPRTSAPTRVPGPAPTRAPTRAPVPAPTRAPTRAPIPTSTRAPTRAPAKPPTRCVALGGKCAVGSTSCCSGRVCVRTTATGPRTCRACKGVSAQCFESRDCCTKKCVLRRGTGRKFCAK